MSQSLTSTIFRILDTLQEFTLNVELPVNTTNDMFIFETYGFVIFDINTRQLMESEIGADLGPPELVKNVSIPVNISFSSDLEQEGLTVYVQVTEDVVDEELRLSVVVYRQENLFQNGTNNGTGVNITSAVMSISGKPSNSPTLSMGFRKLAEDDSQNEVRFVTQTVFILLH